MNTLEQYISTYQLNEVQIMNYLQGAGMISDNAVHASDVAEADCESACQFLSTRLNPATI